MTNPRTTVRDAGASTLLAVYLHDHLAGAVGGLELARRALSHNRGGDLEPFLRQLVEEIRQDRSTLERLMTHLGVEPSRMKNVAAVAAERAGRLKLNGQLLGYSPLSRLVELEGLAAGVHMKLNLWRSLRAALPQQSLPAGIDLESLIDRAEQQRSAIEGHRQSAAEVAFAGAGIGASA